MTITGPDVAAAPGPVSRDRRKLPVRDPVASSRPSVAGLDAPLPPSVVGKVVVHRGVRGPTRRGAVRRVPAVGPMPEVRGRRGRGGLPVRGVPTGRGGRLRREDRAIVRGSASGLVPSRSIQSHGPHALGESPQDANRVPTGSDESRR